MSLYGLTTEAIEDQFSIFKTAIEKCEAAANPTSMNEDTIEGIE